MKFIYLIILMCSFSFGFFANLELAHANQQVEAYVHSIEQQPSTNSTSEQNPNSGPRNNQEGFLGDILGVLLRPVAEVFAYFFIPIVPFVYYTLNLPNSVDTPNTPKRQGQLDYFQNGGISFSTKRFQGSYQWEYFRILTEREQFSEHGFEADFNSLQFAIIPNWEAQFKTGISIGGRELISKSNATNWHAVDGLILGFPTWFHFANTGLSLLYNPQFVSYNSKALGMEWRLGANLKIHKDLSLNIGYDSKHSLGSGKNLSYWNAGITYHF